LEKREEKKEKKREGTKKTFRNCDSTPV